MRGYVQVMIEHVVHRGLHICLRHAKHKLEAHLATPTQPYGGHLFHVSRSGDRRAQS